MLTPRTLLIVPTMRTLLAVLTPRTLLVVPTMRTLLAVLTLLTWNARCAHTPKTQLYHTIIDDILIRCSRFLPNTSSSHKASCLRPILRTHQPAVQSR